MAHSSLKTTQTVSVKQAQSVLHQKEEIRIILVGKTGNGKSESGNTILGRKSFKTAQSPSSVTSECEKAIGRVDGDKIVVIDTPGILDTKYTMTDVIQKLKKCASLASPGPHVFLIAIGLTRYTAADQRAAVLLQEVFGKKTVDHTFILFTHGDQLTVKIEDFISKSPELKRLVEMCNKRYHVLDNKVPNRNQVTELLRKIKMMMNKNGGAFYTNRLFEYAKRETQDETLRKSADREKPNTAFSGLVPERRPKLLEKEYDTKSKDMAGKKKKPIETGLVVASAEAGIAIGTAAGTAGGPICMGLGAAMGGAVGAVLGLITPVAVKALKKECAVQ